MRIKTSCRLRAPTDLSRLARLHPAAPLPHGPRPGEGGPFSARRPDGQFGSTAGRSIESTLPGPMRSRWSCRAARGLVSCGMRFQVWSRVNHFYTFGFHAYRLTKRRIQETRLLEGASEATPCVLVIEHEAHGRASVSLRCGTASRGLARGRPNSWEALASPCSTLVL